MPPPVGQSAPPGRPAAPVHSSARGESPPEDGFPGAALQEVLAVFERARAAVQVADGAAVVLVRSLSWLSKRSSSGSTSTSTRRSLNSAVLGETPRAIDGGPR